MRKILIIVCVFIISGCSLFSKKTETTSNYEQLLRDTIAYEVLGDTEKAINSYKQLFEIDNTNVIVLKNLTDLLMKTRNIEDFIKYNEIYTTIAPNENNTHVQGLMMYNLEKYDLAIKWLKKYLAIDSKNIDVYMLKLHSELELNKTEDAKNTLNDIYTIYPNFSIDKFYENTRNPSLSYNNIGTEKISTVKSLRKIDLPHTSKVNLENCTIKGNIGFNNGEKIYHLPSCPYYSETVINTSYGERYFCSEQEAINAGWRKARDC